MTVKKLRAEIKAWKTQTDAANKKAKDAQDRSTLLEQKLIESGKAYDDLSKVRVVINRELRLAQQQLAERPVEKIEVTPADYDDLKREVKELRERPIETALEIPKDYEPLKKEFAALKDREQNFKNIYACTQKVEQIFSIADSISTSTDFDSVIAYLANEDKDKLSKMLGTLNNLQMKLQAAADLLNLNQAGTDSDNSDTQKKP